MLGPDGAGGMKARVLVVTSQRKFSGYLHRSSADLRETDVLNDERTFIHLTDVEVRKKGEIPSKAVPFVAINKASIVYVIPAEEEDSFSI